MKVKIGNDVCLSVNLLSSSSNNISIHSVRAYFVNVTKYNDLIQEHTRLQAALHEEINTKKNGIKFISRFPVEPMCDEFCSSPYDICCCGNPCYNAYPRHFVPVYGGFGVYPHTFENRTWRKDKLDALYEKAGRMYSELKESLKRLETEARVQFAENSSLIKVYFPASSQIYTGTYKLVVVAKVRELGWDNNNLRTITMEYDDILTLVDSQDDADTTYEPSNPPVINGSDATDIELSTNKIDIYKNQIIRITATVKPDTVANPNVTWQPLYGYDGVTVTPSGNDCIISTNSLSQLTQNWNYKIDIKVSSVQNPQIFDYVEVNIHPTNSPSGTQDNPSDPSNPSPSNPSGSDNQDVDNYVTSGQYDTHNTITLTMNEGDPVTIYMDPNNDWYIPNN